MFQDVIFFCFFEFIEDFQLLFQSIKVKVVAAGEVADQIAYVFFYGFGVDVADFFFYDVYGGAHYFGDFVICF